MSRAVEPERESSLGFVEPVREGREDVPLKDLIEPLDSMPPVDFAFAYGSGVFSQPLHTRVRSNEAPMVDYIFGVSSPVDWHAKNLEQNPRHYSSWLAWFGGRGVSNVAENLGAGVHFNAFVPWKDKKIKYGVISVDNLVKDVYTWQRLYSGGRLQKPVRFLVDRIHGEEMNRKNLQAALTAALLLLPPEFSEEDLYATICGLSYMGDVRMLFAEDKHKVRKIVRGSSSLFQDLYREPINKYATRDILHPPEAFSSDLKSRFKQDGRISTKYLLLSSLPACVLQRLARHTGTQYDSTVPANMAIAKAVVNSKQGHAQLVTKAVSSIVRTSSFRQMLSGLLAAGGVNAVQYVGRKISKAWRSRQ